MRTEKELSSRSEVVSFALAGPFRKIRVAPELDRLDAGTPRAEDPSATRLHYC